MNDNSNNDKTVATPSTIQDETNHFSTGSALIVVNYHIGQSGVTNYLVPV